MPASSENSFDSIDTECSSTTDMSRPEVLTTSLDSTTDCPTDSASDTHSHRLQQMKADSGYKSLETAQSTSIGAIGAPVSRAPSFTKAQFRYPHDTFEGISVSERDRSRDRSHDIEEVGEKEERYGPGRGQVKKSGTSFERRYSGRLAAKKRREILREKQYTSLDTGLSLDSDVGSDEVRGKRTVLAKFLRSNRAPNIRFLQRDFSIDEKSDRLFKEFSQPNAHSELSGSGAGSASGSGGSSGGSGGRRVRLTSRRLQRHLEPSDGSPRSIRRKLSPQDSIEEEDQTSAAFWEFQDQKSFIPDVSASTTLREEPE